MSVPVATDPAWPVQVGIRQLLTADVQLSGLIVDVYDEPPEDISGDYVTVNDLFSTPDAAHGRHGRQVVATLHTWTRARSNKPGNDIGNRLVALLTRQASDLDTLVDGHTVWMVVHEFHQNLRDPQPGVRHRVDRFRIRTAQEE